MPVVSAGTEYQASSSTNVEEEEQSSGNSQKTGVAIVERVKTGILKLKTQLCYKKLENCYQIFTFYSLKRH